MLFGNLCLIHLIWACFVAVALGQGTGCLVQGSRGFLIYGGPGSEYPPCAPGFYCPNFVANNISTWPVICPPTPECAIQRNSLEWCEPQGFFEPVICKAGFYCPIPGLQRLQCPSGHYCPLGSEKPTKCPPLAYCPAGSSRYRFIGVLLIIFIFDGTLAGISGIYYYYRFRKHKDYLDDLAFLSQPSDSTDISGDPQIVSTQYANARKSSRASRAMMDAQSPDAIHTLIGGFHLSRGNQPLLDFEFNDLGLSISKKKKLLSGVTGSIRHGQVTAIMGPSGAGKTTFLSALMGKTDSSWRTEGSLRINGEECKGMSNLKHLVGYVPQEDVMLREMSVWQTIKFSADMRLPREWNNAQRERHVQSILEVLGLEKVRNSPIGDEDNRGISGGQRKRVNIGMELAACPLALFCDEPTSGLDATASLSIISSMKSVCRATGMTAVVVIHQPRLEIWNSLDRILLLAPGGVTAFLGEQRFVSAYFEHFFNLKFKGVENPADMVVDFVNKSGSECALLWKNEGSTWYESHARENQQEGAEFNDDFADAVQASLLDARLRRQSAVIPNEDLEEVFKQSYKPYIQEEAPEHQQLPPWRRPLPSLPRLPPALKPPLPPWRRPLPVPPGQEGLTELRPNERPRGLSRARPSAAPSSSMDLNDSSISLTTSSDSLIASEKPTARKSKRISVLHGDAPNPHERVIRGANVFQQAWLHFGRSFRMQYYQMDSLVLELGLSSLAGVIIGFCSQEHFRGVAIAPYTTISPSTELSIIPMKALYICFAVGVAAATAGVKVLGENQPVFWRESASGFNRISFFVAQNLAVLPRIFLTALHFACFFQLFSLTYNPLGHMFITTLLIVYCVYGLASVVSMIAPRRDAPLLAVVCCIIAAVLNGYVGDFPVEVDYISYGYWAHEAYFTGETEPFVKVNMVKIAADYSLIKRGRRGADYTAMLFIGTVYRCIALPLLLFRHRDKQR